MVIVHPDNNHFGLLFLKPMEANKLVTSSIGQTIHQIRPRKMENAIIKGHQYDQTIKDAKFVFRRYFSVSASEELAVNPITINPMKNTKVIYLSTFGKKEISNKLFKYFIREV